MSIHDAMIRGRIEAFPRAHGNPARRLLMAAVLCGIAAGAHAQRPDDIVDVRSVVEDIVLDIRYVTPHNFVGRPIPGYEAAKCLLTREAAEALGRVQDALRDFRLALKVYDCYRPQSAVDAFVAWARDLDDQAMKAEFYPSVDKQNLFRDGYIAARSGHSRGSTVDLTVVALPVRPSPVFDPDADLRSCENAQSDRFADASIDMGTGYDCFSTRSHTLYANLSPQQRANRLLLKQLMESNGFRHLPEEWWHFTLSEEPYPDVYFDFPVE
jgi:D-alanyl-D-alanine dipeptidase